MLRKIMEERHDHEDKEERMGQEISPMAYCE